MGYIFSDRNSAVPQNLQIDSITLGTVLDNNDPQQMGRLRILCPAFGDDPLDTDPEVLPWATKVAPFGGITNSNTRRGPNKGSKAKGPIAYGLWNVPAVGSTVVVCCLDGDPYYRLWLGSIFDQGSVHTMPHGRYMYDEDGEPEGPLDSLEAPIEPLYSNQNKAFQKKQGNYEWRTRGADYSVAGNPEEFADMAPSSHPDDVVTKKFDAKDGSSFDVKNGYAKSRSGGNTSSSSVYSWTTPGFHSISMDDRPENCRVRVRTTCGAQILMDDTNERIYISTPQGNNWIEMDYNGDIDMYGRRLSMHSTEELNLTSDKTVRIYGKDGIHMYTPQNIHMEAMKDVHTHAGQNLRTKVDQSSYLEVAKNTQIKSGDNVNVQAGKDLHAKAGDNLNTQAGKTLNHLAGISILNTAPKIGQNGPTAAPASPAQASANVRAKWTNRVPQHEPYARGLTKDDYTHAPEHEYDDPNVGRVERGVEIERGDMWRR